MPCKQVFFQGAKTSNQRALLTRSENALLGNIFTFLCCNCDTKHTCKRSFWLSKPNFSKSDVNMSGFSAECAKTVILRFVGFLKIKNSRTSFSLIFENNLPFGFSWQNMKKSVISVLKINSRYLDFSGLNNLIQMSWALEEFSGARGGKYFVLLRRQRQPTPQSAQEKYLTPRVFKESVTVNYADFLGSLQIFPALFFNMWSNIYQS